MHREFRGILGFRAGYDAAASLLNDAEDAATQSTRHRSHDFDVDAIPSLAPATYRPEWAGSLRIPEVETRPRTENPVRAKPSSGTVAVSIHAEAMFAQREE